MSDDELATLRVRERGDVVIANVEGEIDLSNASSLLMDLAASVPNTARGLVVDLSGLEFLDSSGVHMLYDIADRLATRQQRFAVVIPPDAPPRRAIELSGVEPAAWLHADQPSALAALGLALRIASRTTRRSSSVVRGFTSASRATVSPRTVVGNRNAVPASRRATAQRW